jgi:dual specificity protein kinase YAK1
MNYDYIATKDDILFNERIEKSYIIHDRIGEGGYCQVLLVSNLKKTKYYAAKVIRSDSHAIHQIGVKERKILKCLNREEARLKKEQSTIPIMKTLAYPKVVKLKDYFELLQPQRGPNCPELKHNILIFERLELSLFELMESMSFRGMSVWMIQKFALYLVETLVILKRSRVTHCDIKPENIMLEK